MRDEGFTLVEVLIAMLLIETMAAALATLFALGVVNVRDARMETVAAMAAVQKMEQLRALRFVDPADTLGASPADAVDRNVAGFVDFLDGAGRPVADASGAVFVRRWSVRPSDDTESVVVRVFVGQVTRGAGGPDVARVSGRPGQVLLISMRTRYSS